MKIALIACRPHRYAGRMLAAGERFSVRGQSDARVLTAIGAATYAPPIVQPPTPAFAPQSPPPPAVPELADDPAPEPRPEPPAAEDEPKRRRYRRRDLDAEDSGA